MIFKIKNYFLFILLGVVFSGCISVEPIYYEQEIKTADEAVKKFHLLLNEENYEELYNLTDEQARAIKSKDDFVQVMKQIQLRFGKVLNSSKVNAQATSQASSTKVEMVYQTKFEGKEIKEKFVWIVAKKKAGLFSYEVIQ